MYVCVVCAYDNVTVFISFFISSHSYIVCLIAKLISLDSDHGEKFWLEKFVRVLAKEGEAYL